MVCDGERRLVSLLQKVLRHVSVPVGHCLVMKKDGAGNAMLITIKFKNSYKVTLVVEYMGWVNLCGEFLWLVGHYCC